MNHTPNSARELIAATIGSDPWDGIEALRRAGERKARAEGVAYEMDNNRKIVLSRIMNELAVAHSGTALSEAKLERMARADARYGSHISATAEAMEEKEAATAEYYAQKSLLEWDAHASYAWNAASKLER